MTDFRQAGSADPTPAAGAGDLLYQNASDPALTDEQREARIQELSKQMSDAHGKAPREQIIALWEEIRELVKGRNPEQVRKMEIERGLA